VTTTTPAGTPAISARIHTLNRPNMVSVGVIVWLASELMFFAGLFGIYFTARAVNTGPWPPETTHLDIVYDLIFTIILIASSFTCQFGVWAAERGDVFALRRWYIISFLMGLTFVVGQANEFRTMIEEGTTLSSDAYGTVFYLTTGFHGLHVIGGLIAFLLLIARTKMSKFTPAQATSAIVVSYYWHFVDVVWIALFATIFIIR
jgi:cytochrome c oxidase subunit 3